MMNQRTSAQFRATVMILTVAAIACAFVHSAMPAEVSSDESGGLVDILREIFDAVGIKCDPDEHIVRKAAHFTEYTVIGMLLTSCAYSLDCFQCYRFTGYILFAGLGTAFIDETIQLFSEGRAGLVADIWIDFSGIVFGTSVMLLFYFVYQRNKRKRKR